MTKQIFDDFTNISKNYYNPIDQPLLEEVQFSVKDYKFKVNKNIELQTSVKIGASLLYKSKEERIRRLKITI